MVKSLVGDYARPVRPRSLDEVLRAASRRVKAARRELGITQEEAAHRAGMPVRQWQRIESGEAGTLRTFVAVAVALGIDVADLIRR